MSATIVNLSDQLAHTSFLYSITASRGLLQLQRFTVFTSRNATLIRYEILINHNDLRLRIARKVNRSQNDRYDYYQREDAS